MILHVEDIVRGLELGANHELTDIYNLGTGEQYSFNTLVDRINDELGTDIASVYEDNPIPEDVYVHDTMADATKIREATGWEPQISFEEGIERVCSQYN